MQRFYEWLHGDGRFEGLAREMLNRYDNSFIFGGYVRGKFDTQKCVSDLDVAVRAQDFTDAEQFLTRECGCVKSDVDPPRRFWPVDRSARIERVFVRSDCQYARFQCPRGVQVDLIDHEAFKRTLDTMPSDVHYLVANVAGFASYDEAQFSTAELIDAIRNKRYQALLPEGDGCQKLDAEGFTASKKHLFH